MFGLLWDLLNGSAWGNGESRRFPRPARVLLVLTNTAPLVVVVYGALVRDTGGFSVDDFAELGDLVLGVGLLVAAFATGVQAFVQGGRSTPGTRRAGLPHHLRPPCAGPRQRGGLAVVAHVRRRCGTTRARPEAASNKSAQVEGEVVPGPPLGGELSCAADARALAGDFPLGERIAARQPGDRSRWRKIGVVRWNGTLQTTTAPTGGAWRRMSPSEMQT